MIYYLHGAESRKDFEPLVPVSELPLKVDAIETVDGSDRRVFRFECEGYLFALVCDDACGRERLIAPLGKALMESFAERLPHIVRQIA